VGKKRNLLAIASRLLNPRCYFGDYGIADFDHNPRHLNSFACRCLLHQAKRSAENQYTFRMRQSSQPYALLAVAHVPYDHREVMRHSPHPQSRFLIPAPPQKRSDLRIAYQNSCSIRHCSQVFVDGPPKFSQRRFGPFRLARFRYGADHGWNRGKRRRTVPHCDLKASDYCYCFSYTMTLCTEPFPLWPV
jgi:hypothetical protein